MKLPVLLIFLVVCSFAYVPDALGQVERPVRPPAGRLPVKPDTLRPPVDSLEIKNDTLKTDSTKAPPKKDIETTIFYSARDSINSNMQKKIIKLYGDAKIRYGTIELEAEEIVIDYEASTITANGILDSLGRRVGFPIFKDGGSTYETKDMVYNFKTKRAKISEVVTSQGDGFVHGDKVYKNDKNELFSIGNAYTTCNLAHPHFRIISRKSKAIPGDKIVSGPFYMEFMDVPTPLGFIFGIFPQTRKSQSGIIMPTYGEEKTRGFFLKSGGYYFDISDYFKLGITGDLYSKGSSALSINSQYKKRYRYTGSIGFNFTNNRFSPQIENNDRLKDFRLVWSHSPQSKGTGRFSASVNAASASFTTNNYVSVNQLASSTRMDVTTSKLSSNVSYSKTFANSPFSVGINLRHSQDLFTKQVDVPAPDVSFNMNNIYPFKNSTNSVLQNITFRLTSAGTNSITNNLGRIKRYDTTKDSIAPFNMQTLPELFRNAKKGVKHNFPLGTSFKIAKFFVLSPAMTYDEVWYFEKLNWRLNDAGTDVVVSDTIKGFNRIAQYAGSVSLTTRVYGMWINRKKDAKMKAIRHVVNPSASYSFRPDFASEKYGYYQTFNVGEQVIQKSRHENFIYGGASPGKQGAIGFSIGNTLEMKYRGEKDSVDRKISILNSFSLNSNYNLLADSFNLSTFSMSANTNVLDGKLNINVSGIVDPYQYIFTSINENGVLIQRKIDRFVWEDGPFKIGQLSSINFNLSTNLSPKGREKDKDTRDKIADADNITQSDKDFLMNNPDVYVDFDIPWNLRINYTVDYSKPGYARAIITQAIRFSGDLSLTEKWKVDFNSGYDFINKQFTQSQFGIRRDLHCWQVSVNWVPFGRFQNYSFSIGIKSGMLRDLKLDRQRNFIDQL